MRTRWAPNAVIALVLAIVVVTNIWWFSTVPAPWSWLLH